MWIGEECSISILFISTASECFCQSTTFIMSTTFFLFMSEFYDFFISVLFCKFHSFFLNCSKPTVTFYLSALVTISYM